MSAAGGRSSEQKALGVFLLSLSGLVIAFVYQLLSMFGITTPVSESETAELITMGINILALAGVLVDPTTEGFSDSERAMTYCTDCDVRITEEAKNE